MSISITCICGKRLRAPDTLAGKRVKCPACSRGLLLVAPNADAAVKPLQSGSPLQQDAPIPFAPEYPPAEPSLPIAREIVPPTLRPRKPRPPEDVAQVEPLPVSAEPSPTLRHLHWLLGLAMVPLAILILVKGPEKGDFFARYAEALAKAPPDVRRRAEVLMHSDETTLDDLLAALPGQRLPGAHLPRNTWRHWGYAVGAALFFFAFLFLLALEGSSRSLTLGGLGVFTGTVGILFLLLVQAIAEWTQGVWIVPRGVFSLIFYIAKFIGFSYRSAEDPDANFFLSFFGFTFGVGLCEELCKAAPLLLLLARPSGHGWRTAFHWGLASGVGFGVSEAIMYAGDFYNGIEPVGIYVVRFFSCVALHAVWTGSVGVTFYRCQDLFERDMPWYEYFLPLVRIVGVAIVLHGLYDTLLKKDFDALALAVAGLSFLWLAFQISRLHGDDAEAERRAFLKAYKKRRAAMA